MQHYTYKTNQSLSAIRNTATTHQKVQYVHHRECAAVNRPDPSWWFQVHPDNNWHIEFNCYYDKESKTSFLVAPEVCHLLSGLVKNYLLVPCVTTQCAYFLWKLPADNPNNCLPQIPISCRIMEITSHHLGHDLYSRRHANKTQRGWSKNW